MKEKEKMITGKLYNPFDPELIEMRRSAREPTDGVFFYYLPGLILFSQNLTFVRCLSLLSLI